MTNSFTAIDPCAASDFAPDGQSVNEPVPLSNAERRAEKERHYREWARGVRAVGKSLRKLYPLVFRNPVPLRVGVHHAVFALLEGEHERVHIHCFLRQWTHEAAYRDALVEGAPRFDLDGSEAGVVTNRHAVWRLSDWNYTETENDPADGTAGVSI